MYRNRCIPFIAAAASLFGGVASADTIQLTGVIRDFKESHPDMQRTGPNYDVIKGIVKSTLGADGKPVLSGSPKSSWRVESVHSFKTWFNDTPGVNISMPYTITLSNGKNEPGGTYSFAVEKQQVVNGKKSYFFPIDGKGWNDKARDANGDYRNFYFTYEIHTEFTYTDPAKRDYPLTFKFTGDDDVWVFINGKLAVDIGGVHGQATSTINVDNARSTLGLEPGKTYKLDFFFAERHTTESNFRIETTMALKAIPPTTIDPLYD